MPKAFTTLLRPQNLPLLCSADLLSVTKTHSTYDNNPLQFQKGALFARKRKGIALVPLNPKLTLGPILSFQGRLLVSRATLARIPPLTISGICTSADSPTTRSTPTPLRSTSRWVIGIVSCGMLA